MGDKIENSIAGIGLNINQKKFEGDAPNPVSLSLLTGIEYDLKDCLKELSEEIDKRYKQLISENYSLLRGEYVSRLFRLNKWRRYSANGGAFEGRIINVSDNGRLQIEKVSGEMAEFSFKEVDFIL
jgi:BirA family biotin operon repressor/biotin-[acetyl-CoA-carboxylase] ligase